MIKTIEQALDEVVADTKAKQKKNARYLVKIHKLKQDNRVLASRRNSLMDKKIAQAFLPDQMNGYEIYKFSLDLNKISEQIGKNSARILRLRTLIKQSK